MDLPTRPEVATVLRRLNNGEQTRQSASAWACGWLVGDSRISDLVVWEALELLGAADLVNTDRPFLYDVEDFQDCLSTLSTPV
ncbi:hypothetical protein BSF38_03560 [Paludisphaera borealis]|uniref:Uncharacterized protein n=1 Tax=Paludisphaera borealis TaxID=1387353 RepID=A0A1U7CSZ0_9BACT|nr:hypothetical protein BSF38_03560 [Paludisphaera borealis]